MKRTQEITTQEDLMDNISIIINDNNAGPRLNNINLIKQLIDVFSKIKDAEREASVSKENG